MFAAEPMGIHGVNWLLVTVGIGVGVALVASFTFWIGRRFFYELGANNRGDWDKPLPAPFARNRIIAVYKRRRRYHRHHRHYYREQNR